MINFQDSASNSEAIKNFNNDSSILYPRTIVIILVLLIFLILLVYKIFYLQIINYSKYSSKSEQNRIVIKDIKPNRGQIFDNNGNLLATDISVANLYLIPEKIDNLDYILAKIKGYVNLTDNELDNFLKEFNKVGKRSFHKILLKNQLSESEFYVLSANKRNIQGIIIENTLQRNYNYPKLFYHSIGYIGKINRKEKQNLDWNIYKSIQQIGKIGIEKEYEELLRGKPGKIKMETNAAGRLIKRIDGIPPEHGKKLTLYLDLGLQQLAYDLIKDKKGSIVVLEAGTGGILAMVNSPSTNANKFSKRISQKDYSALLNDPDLPLFNRAVAGLYPPASTVKQFIALGALEKNVVSKDWTIFDKGWFRIYGDRSGRVYRNWKRKGHGKVNLEKAIYLSNDTYFYNLGLKIGINDINSWLTEFGFGQKVGVDVFAEKKGILPTPQWKFSKLGVPWRQGDTVNYSIGQGFGLSSNLQLAYSNSILANEGKRIKPRFLKLINDKPFKPKNGELSKLNLQPENLEFIRNAMVKVTSERGATAYWSVGWGAKYKIAGKTGTAQVVGIGQNQKYSDLNLADKHKDHALFVAFAPAEHPKIIISIIIENGESGSGTAGPIARKLLDYYLIKRNKISKSDLIK